MHRDPWLSEALSADDVQCLDNTEAALQYKKRGVGGSRHWGSLGLVQPHRGQTKPDDKENSNRPQATSPSHAANTQQSPLSRSHNFSAFRHNSPTKKQYLTNLESYLEEQLVPESPKMESPVTKSPASENEYDHGRLKSLTEILCKKRSQAPAIDLTLDASPRKRPVMESSISPPVVASGMPRKRIPKKVPDIVFESPVKSPPPKQLKRLKKKIITDDAEEEEEYNDDNIPDCWNTEANEEDTTMRTFYPPEDDDPSERPTPKKPPQTTRTQLQPQRPQQPLLLPQRPQQPQSQTSQAQASQQANWTKKFDNRTSSKPSASATNGKTSSNKPRRRLKKKKVETSPESESGDWSSGSSKGAPEEDEEFLMLQREQEAFNREQDELEARQAGKARQPQTQPKEEEEEEEEGEGEGEEEEVVCDLCGIAGGTMLLCDTKECKRACHLDCLGLTVVPEGDWFCPNCKRVEEQKKIIFSTVRDHQVKSGDVEDEVLGKWGAIAAGLRKVLNNWNNEDKCNESSSNSGGNEDVVSVTKTSRFPQPSWLPPELRLKNYQLAGIQYLQLLHSHNLNCVLADEMGLGKTIQTICHLGLLLRAGNLGPHLVCVPASTYSNWLREFAVWCPALVVLAYRGSQKERNQIQSETRRPLNFHVLLTTYEMCVSQKDDRKFMQKLRFSYMVLDEAHCLKNDNSVRYKHLSAIKVRHIVLLTGTPIQNNLSELASLASFILPGSKENFEVLLGATSDLEERDVAHRVRKILGPFVLRRLKAEVFRRSCCVFHNIF